MPKIHVPEKAPAGAEAVVIGGGIVGTATAYFLSKFGFDTVLLEAREGLSTFTTAASAECFRAQFTEPELAALALESIRVFENFAEFTGLKEASIHLRQQGYLFVTDDEQALPELKAAVAAQHRAGVTDTLYLDAEETRRRFPFVSETVVGATFRQKDGWLSCHELTQGFAKASRAAFLLRTKALAIRVDGKGVQAVETDRGTIATRLVVDAAGPFAGVVAEMVGLRLPLELVRRQKAYIRTDRPPADAPFTVDLVNGSYWRPEAGGALLGWVDPAEPATEPLENPRGDYEFPLLCLEHCRRLTPFWAAVGERLKRSDVNVSAGQYVYTPDGQPLIGPVDSLPGFHLNCGYWFGVMMSPAAGRICAELAAGKRANRDNPFRLSRFEEPGRRKAKSFLSGH